MQLNKNPTIFIINEKINSITLRKYFDPQRTWWYHSILYYNLKICLNAIPIFSSLNNRSGFQWIKMCKLTLEGEQILYVYELLKITVLYCEL